MPHVLDRALAAGVEKVMLTGMSLSDVATNAMLANSRPTGTCFFTIGVHPYHASEPTEDYMNTLRQAVNGALAEKPCLIAAYGELGLDYDRLNYAGKEVQMETFKKQLDMVVQEKWNLPLFLHCRAAFDDFIKIIMPYTPLPRGGLVHSFVGTAEQAAQLTSLGLHISVNGFSFQDRQSLDMVASLPLEKLQIETDAPWGEIKSSSEIAKRYLINAASLPQAKKKDKWDARCMVKERNESCAIERVALVVAGLKGVMVDEMANAAWDNSVGMFKLGDVA